MIFLFAKFAGKVYCNKSSCLFFNRGIFMRLFLFIVLLGTVPFLDGAEYFVSLTGSDENSGLSEKTPFRTIRKGASKLVPGDTLTILPGEYHEEVRINFAGDLKRPTTIRAKINGTVHMRGDVPAPAFKKVPGKSSVYMCKVAVLPEYVLERDTVQKYKKVTSLSELEMSSGSSFFDEKRKLVYIKTTDGRSPEFHCITFSVLRGDALRISGNDVKNFHVRGIMFSGYNSATPNGNYKSTFGGVYMRHPVKSSVKECIVYLCGSGVTFNKFSDSIVEDCIFFANSTEFNNSGGNLLCYGPGKNTIQRNIITFASDMAGQRFYSGKFDNCLIESCFAFDNKYGDIWIKPPSDSARVRKSYVSSLMRARLIEDGIFTTGDTYYHGKAKRSICRSRDGKFDPAKEFADPAHLDFRLLKNSRFRKGGDRGVKGYDPKVVFDDASKLQSGGTLYLTSPRKTPLSLRNLKNIIIRGRGLMAVPLHGALKIENCSNVRLENLNMMGHVSFAGTSQLIVRRCGFLKKVAFPAQTQVRHNLFAEDVTGADSGFLRGNIFCKSYTGRPAFSGWNAYVTGTIPAFETASWKAPAPLFNDLATGDLTLKNHYAFAGKCADGFPNGQYRYDTVCLREGLALEKGRITSGSAAFFIRSGTDTGATVKITGANQKFIKSAKGSGEYAVTFTGLRPGQRYTALCLVTPTAVKRLTNAPRVSEKSEKFTCTFSTPVKDSPRTIYVSTKGRSVNDGSSWGKALSEINTAIKKAGPGDTVLIAGGVYKEQLRVFATGSKGKVLTIAGAPGAAVVIDGNKNFRRGALIDGREFVRLDNMTFRCFMGSGGDPHASAVMVTNSSDIHISRIFCDNRHGTLQRSFVGRDVKNMILENSVAITPFGGYEFHRCPNLEIRHCVFFRGKTLNGRIGTAVGCPASVHHCIFVGQEIQKVKNPTFGASDIGTFKEHDNGFFVRVPRHEKPIIGFDKLNGKTLPLNDGGGILNKEWKRQGRFYNQTLTYDDFCKEQNRKPTAVFGDPRMKALTFFYRFDSLQQWYEHFVLNKLGDAGKAAFREARVKEMQPQKNFRITDYIARNPEFSKRKIGLDPDAFKDFR